VNLDTGGRSAGFDAPASFQSLAARLSRVLGAAVTSTLDVAVVASLEELGRFADVDVAFVTLVDDDDRVSNDWHWIRPGREALAPAIGSPIAATFGSATGFLRLGHSVAVGDLFEIDLAPTERALATANGLRAILMAPVLVDTQLLGLVGLQAFDDPHQWDAAAINQLEIVAQLLVQAVTRTQERGALALANARARRIAEYIPDGLLLLDTGGVITWVSPSFVRMSGASEGDLVGQCAETLFHSSHQAPLNDKIRAVAIHHESCLNAQMRDPNGNWRWADLAFRLAADSASGVPDEIVMTVHDSHERHLREMQLTRRGDCDALTGLLNRAALDQAIAELAANSRNVLVAFCDIDDFKSVNDDLGHDVGDDVLRAIGSVLRNAIRPDDLIARIGGDEFVVVVTGTHRQDDAKQLGARLVKSVRSLAAARTDVSLSVGICGPGPASDMSAMLKRADDAMYQAKRRGKNQYVHRHSTEPARDH
jgi:diguanylate cyclase (GGDEF)-like protein/PAS domain S-box-containing protein